MAECSENRKKTRILKDIRDLCDSGGREINPEKSAEYFHQLANFYKDDSKRSFIYRSTLLNAVLHRLTEVQAKTSVEDEICDLGKQLLMQCNAENKDCNLLQTSRELQEKLRIRRSAIKGELRKLTKISCNELGEALLDLEKQRIETVKSLMQKVTNFYMLTMKEVSSTVIDTLGKPPCRFSHFAMGSLAREEVTLHSDFENGIILEDEAGSAVIAEQSLSCDADTMCSKRETILEYFRWYTVIFHVILINLGQTPIHLIGIDGLNDQYSDNPLDNWFYDCHTPSGITFDSFLPFASKTPYGRQPTTKKPYSIELILPMQEMLEFLTEERSLTEGYHLSDMLVESRHVAGDEQLFDLYKKKSFDMMSRLKKCSEYIQITARNAKDDLKKFDLTPELTTIGWTQNAKKLYYRPMSVYVPWLTKLCGVFGCKNSFVAIEKLATENGCLLPDVAKHNLLYALAVANQLRLEIYFDRSKQSDIMIGTVHPINKTDNIMNVFDAVGERTALDYCEISLGLRSAVTEIVDTIHSTLMKGDDIDEQSILKILNKHITPRGNLQLQGDIHHHFQDYDKAIHCYEKELNRYSNEVLDNSTEHKIEILMALGITCLHALQFERSVGYYKRAIEMERTLDRGDVSKFNIAMASTMLGQCYIEEPTIRFNFGACMQEGIRLWDELTFCNPHNKDYLKGLAEARDTEGFYFLRTLQYPQSLSKYREAADLFREVYGEAIINNDTMKVANGIAMCLLRLERFDEAAQMFDKLIKAKQSVIGHEIAEVNLAWYLRSKGDALKNLQKFEEAIECYKQSISIRDAAPGSEYDKYSAIGNTKCRLADCYFRCGRYDEALKTADEVFSLVSHHIADTVKGREFKALAENLQKDVQEMA